MKKLLILFGIFFTVFFAAKTYAVSTSNFSNSKLANQGFCSLQKDSNKQNGFSDNLILDVTDDDVCGFERKKITYSCTACNCTSIIINKFKIDKHSTSSTINKFYFQSYPSLLVFISVFRL